MDGCSVCGRPKITAVCFKSGKEICKDCCIKNSDGIMTCEYYQVCW